MSLGIPEPVAAHLWQSTAFVGLVWLATIALRHNAARVRYWLWMAASVKFLVPVAWLVTLGAQFEWRAAPPSAYPAAAFVIEQVLAPPSLEASVPRDVPSPSFLFETMVTVWLVGVAGVCVWWWRQWLPVRAALRAATRLRLDSVEVLRGLTAMSSPMAMEPGVVGIWRPVLLLPEGLLEQLTPAQVDALVAHEWSHVRHHDNLTAAVHMAIEALFWFHPLVWWIERRLIDERERACDEDVVRAGCQPADYAEGILAVCRLSLRTRLACVAGVTGSDLRRRLETILGGGMSRPMSAGRCCALAVTAVVGIGVPIVAGAVRAVPLAIAQSPADNGFTFEVASIRPAQPPSQPRGPLEASIEGLSGRLLVRSARNGRFRTVGTPLHGLIQMAYNVRHFQIEGDASWVRSERFAIEATAPGSPTVDQVRAALRSLLADRFKLALHRETQTRPVYELVPASRGLKITPMKEGDCIVINATNPPPPMLMTPERPVYICDRGGMVTTYRRKIVTMPPDRSDRIEAGDITMAQLVEIVVDDIGRPVIDRTGFTERFNLLLDFAPQSELTVGTGTSSAPTIFTALEEQLGLRLRATTGPVEVLVIDRAERPSEN